MLGLMHIGEAPAHVELMVKRGRQGSQIITQMNVRGP